jgi:hypothetical protein
VGDAESTGAEEGRALGEEEPERRAGSAREALLRDGEVLPVMLPLGEALLLALLLRLGEAVKEPEVVMLPVMLLLVLLLRLDEPEVVRLGEAVLLELPPAAALTVPCTARSTARAVEGLLK